MSEPKEPIESVPAQLTPAEKAQLAKRTNAQMDLAKVCQEFVFSFPMDAPAQAAMLTQLKSLQGCFDALVDLLLAGQLVIAVPGPPDEKGEPTMAPSASMLTRASYLEVCALKMEQQASTLRKALLSAGVRATMQKPRSN